MPEEDIADSGRLVALLPPDLLPPDPTRLFTSSSISGLSRIVGGGGYTISIIR